jgi:Mg-chelatase subunit ChlD
MRQNLVTKLKNFLMEKQSNKNAAQGTNKTTLYQFIIDRSGSMSGLEQMVVGGYNEHLSAVKNMQATYPDQQFLVSLLTFDDDVQWLVKPAPINELNELPNDAFKPRGMTALLDAIGKGIHQIESEYDRKIQNDEMSVVLVIITDGEENASRFFNLRSIAHKIKERDQTGKWTFSFIGCDFDASNISKKLNIRRENVRNYNKREYGLMSKSVDKTFMRYAESKSNGSFGKQVFHFFEEDEEDEKKNEH